MTKSERMDISQRLSAYLDGELEGDQRRQVERLLRDNAPARQLLEELRCTTALVAALPRHAAPESIAVDLEAMAARRELLSDFDDGGLQQTALRTNRLRWLATAAMLAFAVGGSAWMVGWLGGPSGGSEPRLALTDAVPDGNVPGSIPGMVAPGSDSFSKIRSMPEAEETTDLARTAARRSAGRAGGDSGLASAMQMETAADLAETAAVSSSAGSQTDADWFAARFGHEAISLTIPTSDEDGGRSAAALAMAYLGRRGVTDLATFGGQGDIRGVGSIAKKKSGRASSTGAALTSTTSLPDRFFLGTSEKRHTDGRRVRRVYLRVPAREVGGLVRHLKSTTPNLAKTELRMAAMPVVLRGETGFQMLDLIGHAEATGGAEDTPSTDAATYAGGDHRHRANANKGRADAAHDRGNALDELLRSIGVADVIEAMAGDSTSGPQEEAISNEHATGEPTRSVNADAKRGARRATPSARPEPSGELGDRVNDVVVDSSDEETRSLGGVSKRESGVGGQRAQEERSAGATGSGFAATRDSAEPNKEVSLDTATSSPKSDGAMASVSTDTGDAASTPDGDTVTSVRKTGGAMASLSTDADGPKSAAVEKRKAARRAGRTTLVGKGIQRLTTADAKTRAVGGKGEAAKAERSRSADKRDTKKDEHVEGAAPGQPPVSRDSAKPVSPDDKLVTLVIEWVAPPASSPAKVRSSKTGGSAHKTRKAKPPGKKPATR